MNKYDELINKQQKEFNAFPMAFAYSQQQFKEGLLKLGLNENDNDKVVAISAGGFIRKNDLEKFRDLTNRLEKELDDAIKADTTGTGFIYDMFVSELFNHEYAYTYDLEETLSALALTEKDFEENEALQNGLDLAIKHVLSGEE